jgi:predicted Zn finger-like uncharacterized protein
MKFLCDRCGTRYSIADTKVRQKILRIRCKTCDNVITVRESGDAPVDDPRPRTMSVGTAGATPMGPDRSAPPPGRSAGMPPPRLPQAADWHLAVDGQQTGPFTVTRLAQEITQQKVGAEVYVWKDGFDGWKEPHLVPPVKAELASLKSQQGPAKKTSKNPLRAPPPPAAARLGKSAPSPRAVAAQAGGDFGEEEATQIQPFSAAVAAAGAGVAGDEMELDLAVDMLHDEPMTEVSLGAGPRSNLDGLFSGPGTAGGARPGRQQERQQDRHDRSDAKTPLVDVFGNPSSTFFPPPAMDAPAVKGAHGIPPIAQVPAGESGLSKVVGIGGVFERKPKLRMAMGAAALVLVAGAVAFALLGGGRDGSRPAMADRNGDGRRANVSPEEARAEAAAWFRKNGGDPKTVTVVSEVDKAGKRPVTPVARKPGEKPELTPPPLEPPPIAVTKPTIERPVERVLPERGVVAQGRKPVKATNLDQSAISAVIKRRDNQVAVTACYERTLRRAGDKSGGRVDVEVTVGLSGKVTDVVLHIPTELSPLKACLETVVSRWRFPTTGEAYDAAFTLHFQGA